MNITQFLKSLGLEHLRDIFETEQVSGMPLLDLSDIFIFLIEKGKEKPQTSHLQKNKCVQVFFRFSANELPDTIWWSCKTHESIFSCWIKVSSSFHINIHHDYQFGLYSESFLGPCELWTWWL